jgi:hypothetical protein
MTPFEQLEYFLTQALERVADEKLKYLSDALIPRLPEVVNGLADIISSQDANVTSATRLRCCELLLRVWSRIVKFDLTGQRVAALRDRASAERAAATATKMAARAANKKHDLVVAKTRRRYARALAKANGPEQETK